MSRLNVPRPVKARMRGATRAYPIGAKVLVDGRDLAIVRGVWPEGSTFALYPHFVLDFVQGDLGVKVAWKRVGTTRARNKHAKTS